MERTQGGKDAFKRQHTCGWRTRSGAEERGFQQLNIHRAFATS